MNPALWVLAIVSALIFIGLIRQVPAAPEEPSPAPSAAPATTDAPHVSVGELAVAYSDNEVAADQKYGGKTVIADGAVRRVEKSGSDRTLVIGAMDTDMIECQFSQDSDSDLASLSKGDLVSVYGTVEGGHFLVHMKDCRLVPR